MEVSVLGISHATASVDVRETYALPAPLARKVLRAVRTHDGRTEALVLDTCNRTEIYFARRKDVPEEILLTAMRQLHGVPSGQQAEEGVYRYDGPEAVRHLFRVAAGLDSQVLGESEILGQLKAAYRMALEERSARFALNRLLHTAFRVGKRVRTETRLGQGAGGIAQAAVAMATGLFGSLAGRTVLLIGAGQTGEQIARALVVSGATRILVASRTLYRAQDLAARIASGASAEDHGRDDSPVSSAADSGLLHGATRPCKLAARPGHEVSAEGLELADLERHLATADLILTCTGAAEPILRAEGLGDSLGRRGRPVLVVDVAVPRDVDPAVDHLPDVTLRNIDDLNEVVGRTLEARRAEIPAAEAIVDEEVGLFLRWLHSRRVAPTIRLLQRRLETIRRDELERHGRQFEDAEQLDRFTGSLVRKLLHQPMAFLHSLADGEENSQTMAAVDTVRRMFDLDALEEET